MTSLEQSKISLKKNDQVQVIAGREKGKIGKILKIDLKKSRVTVENINMVKRHTKATQGQAGGIVERELSLHFSNVLIHCQKCSRGVRHGIRVVENSGVEAGKEARTKKIRVCKRCDQPLDVA